MFIFPFRCFRRLRIRLSHIRWTKRQMWVLILNFFGRQAVPQSPPYFQAPGHLVPRHLKRKGDFSCGIGFHPRKRWNSPYRLIRSLDSRAPSGLKYCTLNGTSEANPWMGKLEDNFYLLIWSKAWNLRTPTFSGSFSRVQSWSHIASHTLITTRKLYYIITLLSGTNVLTRFPRSTRFWTSAILKSLLKYKFNIKYKIEYYVEYINNFK
jgi:hypothetical protein